MNVKLNFWAGDVAPEHKDVFADAIATLFKYAGRPVDTVPSTSAQYLTQETAVAEVPSTTEVEAAKEVIKPKRKRRTKAQIAADNAAPVEPAITEPVAPVEPAITEPVAPVEQADVKAAIVAAVGRLTASGSDSPTRAVVEKLIELTGKKKVSEIEPEHYAVVIENLASVGE